MGDRRKRPLITHGSSVRPVDRADSWTQPRSTRNRYLFSCRGGLLSRQKLPIARRARGVLAAISWPICCQGLFSGVEACRSFGREAAAAAYGSLHCSSDTKFCHAPTKQLAMLYIIVRLCRLVFSLLKSDASSLRYRL